MEYILLEWFHDIEDEPYLIYSEIDNQRYETRKIEVFKNGTCLRCGEEILNSSIDLADIAFPENIDEINRDKQFHAKYITKKDFEKFWDSINNCIRIVKEIYKIDDNSECEKYANGIFKIAHSIGGDNYGEATIRGIAEALHKRNYTP